jgi:copper chaperone
MLSFEVNDMTCGHCASAITKALKAVDPDARVGIDLNSHRVQVKPAAANAAQLADAIREAGYSPVEVQSAVATPAKAGGCCGCCSR